MTTIVSRLGAKLGVVISPHGTFMSDIYLQTTGFNRVPTGFSVDFRPDYG
jgi:hypothetical protein